MTCMGIKTPAFTTCARHRIYKSILASELSEELQLGGYMDKKQIEIQDVQDFWTKNPMIYNSAKSISPEQILENSVSKIREKGWYMQESNKKLFSNLIDYSSLKNNNKNR